MHLAFALFTCAVETKHVKDCKCPVICSWVMISAVQVQQQFLKLLVTKHDHLANCLHPFTSLSLRI